MNMSNDPIINYSLVQQSNLYLSTIFLKAFLSLVLNSMKSYSFQEAIYIGCMVVFILIFQVN